MKGQPDPFAALGLAARFDLDAGQIERAFLARAAALHPDLSDPGKAGDAARASAVLNDARRVLDDPERRAEALMAVLGGPGKSEDKSMPDGFLMEIMETRQQIEAEADDPAARARWQAWAEQRRAEYVTQVGAMFTELGTEPEETGLGAIRRVLNAWRYIERLIEQLDPEYDAGVADFS